MSLSPFVTSSSSVSALTSNSPSTPLKTTTTNSNNSRHIKIIEKILTDLEDLCKKLINYSKGIQEEEEERDEEERNEDLRESLNYERSNEFGGDRLNDNDNDTNKTIRDGCYELQKFCFKLEFLLQFDLKEKKVGFLSTPTSSTANHAVGTTSNTVDNLNLTSNMNKEYWTFINDILKSSRGFQDAIKYVKNINEIKSNLGKARAFIRFCLQYHRLADAIQHLVMEKKVLNQYYNERAVWHNEDYKARIIQLLYDLNDLNFDLITRNNFELDASWPTIDLQNNKKYHKHKSMRQNLRLSSNRTRGNSISSFLSHNIIMNNNNNNNNNNNLEKDQVIL
jgi:hypothetical protein